MYITVFLDVTPCSLVDKYQTIPRHTLEDSNHISFEVELQGHMHPNFGILSQPQVSYLPVNQASGPFAYSEQMNLNMTYP
jgi:hypothetical protein